MLARKCPAVNTHVLYLESLQQLFPLPFLGRLRQLLLSPLIGQRERESEREKEREGKREEWEAMDSGIAFLGRGGSKDQDFCWVSIDCPFTDLSKGGDTTKPWQSLKNSNSTIAISTFVSYLMPKPSCGRIVKLLLVYQPSWVI